MAASLFRLGLVVYPLRRWILRAGQIPTSVHSRAESYQIEDIAATVRGPELLGATYSHVMYQVFNRNRELNCLT
jgi:hypothetical protein